MDEGKIIILKKAHIESLMEAMHQLFHMGVEFVDISSNEEGVFLSFSKDYMDEEFKDSFEDIGDMDQETNEINIKLSDEDLDTIV